MMDEKDTGFTLRDKLVLLVFAVGMGIIVYGILTHGWYMDEISGVFLAMGILMGIVGGLSEKEIRRTVRDRCKKILRFAAVVIGVCEVFWLLQKTE